MRATEADPAKMPSAADGEPLDRAIVAADAARAFDRAITASGMTDADVAEALGVHPENVRRMRSDAPEDVQAVPTIADVLALPRPVALFLLDELKQGANVTSPKSTISKLDDVDLMGEPRTLSERLTMVYAAKPPLSLLLPPITDCTPIYATRRGKTNLDIDVWIARDALDVVYGAMDEATDKQKALGDRFGPPWVLDFLSAAGAAVIQVAGLLFRTTDLDAVAKGNTLSFLGERLSWDFRRALLQTTLDATEWNLRHASEVFRMAGAPAVIREIQRLDLVPEYDEAKKANKVRRGGHRTRTTLPHRQG